MITEDLQQPAYDESDRTGLEDIMRMSPIQGDVYREAYRCPVSTPANTRVGGKHNLFVAYTPGTRRSLQIPNFISNPRCKQNAVAVSPFNPNFKSKDRPEAKPRKKNLDFYYTDKPSVQTVIKVDPTGIHSAGWLKALCSQPVDEIFGKYKRRSEYHSGKDLWGRNISTPGERALVQAWSCNISSRASSSLSRSTHSEMASGITDSRLSSHRGASSLGMEPSKTPPSFALMPVKVHKRPKTEMPKRFGLNRTSSRKQNLPKQTSPYKFDPVLDDLSKRKTSPDDQTHFPDVIRQRSPDFAFRHRKDLHHQAEETSPSLILHNDLDDGVIQVYPLSKLLGSKTPLSKLFDNKTTVDTSPTCTFCVAVENKHVKHLQ